MTADNKIAQRLRNHAATLRTKSLPLSDLVPLLCEAADALDAPSPAEAHALSRLDWDSMCEAFSRVIEAHAHKDSPFHDPVNADATLALRELRHALPAIKAFKAQPKGLTSVCHIECDGCLDAGKCAFPGKPAEPVRYPHPDEDDAVTLWAEIHRLRAAVQGPDGYATWQEAATAERVRRVAAEKAQAAAQAPAPAPQGGVDCIGLALDLEARAKTVESQTTERAMSAAAHGLRLLASAQAPAVAHGPLTREQVYALLPQRLRSVEFAASEVFNLGDVCAAVNAALEGKHA